MTGFLSKTKRGLNRAFLILLRLLLRPFRNEKTLLIVRTDGIGDFVFFSRYLECLRKHFSDHKICLVCRPETAELARFVREIDQVRSIHHLNYRWNYAYRLWVLTRIREFKPSLAIYATFHREHIGDEMTLLSGAMKTIAFSGNDEQIDPKVRARNGQLYTTIVDVDDHIEEREKYVKLFQALKIPAVQESRLGLFPEKEPAGRKSSGAGHAHVVIGPGGSAAIRRWPAEHFSAIVSRIGSEFDVDIVLCGSSEERQLLESIASESGAAVSIMAGKPLKEVATMISSAQLFVGNESGLLHLAASSNVKAVGILGGGHFKRYFPYGKTHILTNRLPCFECNWQCIYDRPFCITEVTVEEVMKAVRKAMPRKKPLRR